MSDKMKCIVNGYQTPDFEVLEISIEQGFATSQANGTVTPPDWGTGNEDWF